MPSELSPGGGNARMTKGQIKKYLRDAEKARKLAAEKLKAAETSGELEKEKKELKDLEKQLDNL